MNKKVIKANKAVFDYWLDDGKVLCRSKNNPMESWNEIKEPLWLDKYHYIQDDTYIQFRKALAENKLLQVNVNYDVHNPDWRDTSTENANHSAFFIAWKVEFIRIKPEEPMAMTNTQYIALSKQTKVPINILKSLSKKQLLNFGPDDFCEYNDDYRYALTPIKNTQAYKLTSHHRMTSDSYGVITANGKYISSWYLKEQELELYQKLNDK